MLDIISILPDSVANQIAAGEVVEKPASAVKELLDNALDAGATQIQLIVKDAGRTLIQVVDNGCGMTESDARLCFERHATSKIHNADDLFAIRTMGFRGEALASIAAIAQVELKSKKIENDMGTCVTIEGSVVKSQQPCNCSNGTCIAVKNLFYNVPARRNFLKKDSVELGHIEEVFKRVAIVNYNVSFSFYSNGKLMYDLKSSSMGQRICQLFGNLYNERLYSVNETTELVKVHGFVCKPEYVKRSRNEQYLFVNGRYIKHPMLNAAIEKAYTDLIVDKSYPCYFICLDVDPTRLDVNIHPHKIEVRFEDESAIFAILRSAVKRSLGQFSLNELNFDNSESGFFSPVPNGYEPQMPTVTINPDYNPFASASNRKESTPNFCTGMNRSGGATMEKWSRASAPNRWETFFDMDSSGGNESAQQVVQSSINVDVQQCEPKMFFENSSFLQLSNRYIVGTMRSGLMVIDQQRAYERIVFDRLMSREKIESVAQQLLYPVNCTFSPADSEIFSELIPDLLDFGFRIEPMSRNTFVVSATPSGVNDNEIQVLFEQLILDVKTSMMQKFNRRDESLCRSLARRMAADMNKPMIQDEMQRFVADLFQCQVPNVSPNGEPVLTIVAPENLLK